MYVEEDGQLVWVANMEGNKPTHVNAHYTKEAMEYFGISPEIPQEPETMR